MNYLLDATDLMECHCRLHEAVMEGDYELTRTLLQTCDINEADDNLGGRTALHLAAIRGRADLMSLLLSHGADATVSDNQGNTALHWCGHEDCVELLVDYGANVLQR
jgi:ankyrin repeat protein